MVYRYIRNLSKTKSIPPTVYLETSTASFDELKSQLFNCYFHSVFNKPSHNYDDTQQQLNSLSSLTVTEAEVFEALSQLDTSKAVGIDGIGP